MAFIDQQDDPNNPQKGQGGQQPGLAPEIGQGSSVVGSGGGGGGGGNPSAGVGPGGTGGWTNIQAYLDANKGDTGSADALNKAVGDQFGQERQNFTNDSSKELSDAQSTADKNKITNDQADQYVNQAAGMYYGQPGADGSPAPADGSDPQYKSIVDKFTHALNDKYSGPTSYDYSLGNQTQQYGADLKDNPSFDTLMSGIYSQKAGAPLSSGQYDLQKQFDVNNQSLVDARNNLSNQYDQLNADRDKTVADTSAGLSNIEQGYRTDQNALHDYLSGQSNAYQTKEQQAEADAKAGYQSAYTGQKMTNTAAMAGLGIENDPGYYAALGVPDRGQLTPQQMQREQELINQGYSAPNAQDVGAYYYVSHRPNSLPVWGQLQENAGKNAADLTNWYGNQEQQYANTGDSEKRAYNSLQDFLGSSDPRMAQGFDVGAPYKAPSGGIRGGR